MNESTKLMRKLDKEYQDISGLSERRFYSIFYSQINPHPILLLGYNPGGDPDTWNESKLASTSFYENGEHEYVDCDYKLAKAMRTYLSSVLKMEDKNEIRKIPKTNLIFRRSPSIAKLKKKKEATREAMPILKQILSRVSPQVIICEGVTALKRFEKSYCKDVSEEMDDNNISTPNGRYPARIYKAKRARVNSIGKEVHLIGIGYPSRYSGRSEWSEVIHASKKILQQFQIAT